MLAGLSIAGAASGAAIAGAACGAAAAGAPRVAAIKDTDCDSAANLRAIATTELSRTGRDD